MLSCKPLKLKTKPPYVFVTLPQAEPRYTSQACAGAPLARSVGSPYGWKSIATRINRAPGTPLESWRCRHAA
jgi:hypothetical protein